MRMTRQERLALHKKQERLQVKSGVPSVAELKEGVPVLRSTGAGIAEYVRHNGVLYKKTLDKESDTDGDKHTLDLIGIDNTTTSSYISFQDGNGLETQAFHIVNDTDNNLLKIRGDLSGGFGDIMALKRENGDVGIGMETYGSDVSATNGGVHIETVSGGAFINIGRDGTSSSNRITFWNDNGQVGSIASSGSATAFNTSSDYRLKENEVPISDGLDRLNQLKPYRFNFKADANETLDGFFAHEVQGIVPQAITGEKDAVKEDGSIDAQGIDQSKLIPLLVSAIQELSAKIDTMQEEINNLKSS